MRVPEPVEEVVEGGRVVDGEEEDHEEELIVVEDLVGEMAGVDEQVEEEGGDHDEGKELGDQLECRAEGLLGLGVEVEGRDCKPVGEALKGQVENVVGLELHS